MKLASHKCTSLRLVGEIAPALAAVANAAPREFHSYFEDAVDLLLGWTANPGLSDDHRVTINAAFASFSPHWRDERHRPFATGMQRKVVADMQKLVEGWNLCERSSGGFQREWEGFAREGGSMRKLEGSIPRPRDIPLQSRFYGISVAMGNLGELYETTAPILLTPSRI
ncbi:unnamed protein product [Symbiodinium natans]|uniref:Uncharacterized protein n=1 Tax=Symbiodinium natans TaxID=878477 RepID=A0A812LHD4_9DINO|nr:unnamed protein product [Symbiodinium natans]